VSKGRIIHFAKHVGLIVAVAPIVSACSGLTDLSIKDQQWFSRTDKLFNQSSIEAAPLTTVKAVTSEDLMSADGTCPGMAAPADANASTEAGQSTAAIPAPTGSVALGHTECDVARAIGMAPDSFNLSTDPRGERLAQVTYNRGPRPGAYTFTAGRLTAVERVDVPEPVKPARQAKPKKRTAS